MNATIERIEKQQIQKSIPPFHIGDTVQVFVKVIEGDRERTQVFGGNVMRRGGGRPPAQPTGPTRAPRPASSIPAMSW